MNYLKTIIKQFISNSISYLKANPLIIINIVNINTNSKNKQNNNKSLK